jgi:hypothetical protein
MNIAISLKTPRRLGASAGARPPENTLYGSLTEKQRNRWFVFGETLRAEALLDWLSVAPHSQIHSDMPARRSSTQSKITLSGSFHNISKGC